MDDPIDPFKVPHLVPGVEFIRLNPNIAMHPDGTPVVGSRQFVLDVNEYREQMPKKMMQRPGFGGAGKKIQLKLNSHRIESLPTDRIYQYDVSHMPLREDSDASIPKSLELMLNTVSRSKSAMARRSVASSKPSGAPTNSTSDFLAVASIGCMTAASWLGMSFLSLLFQIERVLTLSLGPPNNSRKISSSWSTLTPSPIAMSPNLPRTYQSMYHRSASVLEKTPRTLILSSSERRPTSISTRSMPFSMARLILVPGSSMQSVSGPLSCVQLCRRMSQLMDVDFLDHLIRENPAKNHINIKKSYFDRDHGAMTDLGDGVEAMRGVYQSIRMAEVRRRFLIRLQSRTNMRHNTGQALGPECGRLTHYVLASLLFPIAGQPAE